MTNLQITHLMDEIDEILDNGTFRFRGHCFVNADDIQNILSKMRHILPTEIKNAEMIEKRRDDIYMEAQNRADRIINEAQVEASRILSEHELMKTVQKQAIDIQQQLKNTCEEMKNKAEEESEQLKRNAYQEAINTREGARAYAEELFAGLERDVDKIYKHIKSCQEYISQQKDGAGESKTNQEAYSK